MISQGSSSLNSSRILTPHTLCSLISLHLLQNKHQGWDSWFSWPQILGISLQPRAFREAFGDDVHGNKGSGMCQLMCHLSHATLVVTTFLAMPTGLVAQWCEDDQKHQQMISIPLETYAQGCVKDVEEGLEVKLSPQTVGSLLPIITSPWSLPALTFLASQHTMCEAAPAAICPAWRLHGAWGGWAGGEGRLGSKALESHQYLTHLRWPRRLATH